MSRLHSSVSALSWSLVGEILNIIAGLFVFVVAALLLDVDDVGRYAAIIGVATVVTPLALSGRPQILQVEFAAGRNLATSWTEGLQVVVASSLVVSLGAGVIAAVIVPEAAWWAGLLVASGTIVGQSVVELTVAAHQARKQMAGIARLRSFVAVSRLGFAGSLLLLEEATLDSLALVTGLGWAAAVLFALLTAHRTFGGRLSFRLPTLASATRGRSYVPSAASFALLDAVDRPLLVAFGFDAEAGAYAAAFRFVAMAGLPTMALVRYTDQDFFRLGRQSAAASMDFANRLAKRVSLLHLVSAGALFAFAPALPLVFGAEFDQSVPMVRWLCVIPLIRGAQVFYANSLTGSGHQADRNRSLFAAMGLNLALNLLLIPAYGWKGAVGATLAAEVLRAVIVRQRASFHASNASPGRL